MSTAVFAPHFWAAVEDCLVTFHELKPFEAAQKVTSLWRRLPIALDRLQSYVFGHDLPRGALADRLQSGKSRYAGCLASTGISGATSAERVNWALIFRAAGQ